MDGPGTHSGVGGLAGNELSQCHVVATEHDFLEHEDVLAVCPMKTVDQIYT